MLIDLIKQRQSCRTYLPQGVPRELIVSCLEAARLSPSACNSQPWYFIVVDEPQLKDELCEAVFQGPYAMNHFSKKAPVIIAVITETSAFLARIGGFFRGTQYALIDVGIAVEHFILQAAERGLATCWIGWFDEKKAKKILRVPMNKKIDCLICLGYSEEEQREKNRKSMKDIVSYNRYTTKNS
jgi:nitroreductase